MKSKLFLSVLFASLFFLPLSAKAVSEAQFDTLYAQTVLPFYESKGIVGSFLGQKKVSIAYKFFDHAKVDGSEDLGAIVLVTGQAEPSDRYSELVYDLYRKGYSIYLYDHRGQGYSGRMTSDPQVSYVRHFQHYVEDLSSFIETVVKPHRKESTHQKLYLLAHSMGGAVSAFYLEQHPTTFNAAVLVSPMIEIQTKPYSRFTAGLIAGLGCFLGQGKNYALGQEPWHPIPDVKESRVTTSAVRWSAFQQLLKDHPELAVGGVSYRWVDEALHVTSRIEADALKIKTPTLILRAGQDQLVQPKAELDFCEKSKACRLIDYLQSQHEIFSEVDSIRDSALDATLKQFSAY